MFKEHVRKNYRECCSKEDYFNIRRDFHAYKKEKPEEWKKEFDSLIFKPNPFAKIILGTSREKYTNFGKLILTQDKFNLNHYLLIPNDLKYFNALTLQKEDIPLLLEMSRLVNKYMSKDENDEYMLFFHCYPYNSIHTLHLHVIKKEFYSPRKNDLMLDDALYILKNENMLILGYDNKEKVEEILDEWFSSESLTMLNIYIAALILIEQSHILINKNEYIPIALNLVLDYLFTKQMISDKQYILDYIEEDKHTLTSLTDVLFSLCKKSHLLQKRIN